MLQFADDFDAPLLRKLEARKVIGTLGNNAMQQPDLARVSPTIRADREVKEKPHPRAAGKPGIQGFGNPPGGVPAGRKECSHE